MASQPSEGSKTAVPLVADRGSHSEWQLTDPVELYDVAADPHETTNLARTHDTDAREGLALLEQW